MSQHRTTTRKPRLSDGIKHPVVTRPALWFEVALTDTCMYGCKVMARTDKPEVTTVMHSRVYGCTHPEAK